MYESKLINVKDMASYYIIYNTGPLSEKIKHRGISHLIEHCMCCDIIGKYEDELKKDGITFNAATYDSYITFYIYGLEKYILKHIPIFTKKIVEYQITEKNFNTEREIVIEEMKQIYSSKNDLVLINFNINYFNYYTGLGEEQALRNLTYIEFMNHKNKYYNKPNEILINTYNPLKDIKYINNPELYSKIKKQKDYPSFYRKNDMDLFSIKDNNSYVILYSIFKNNKNYINYNCLNLLGYTLVNGFNSLLQKNLRIKLKGTYGVSQECIELNDKEILLYFKFQTSNTKTKEMVDCGLNILNNDKLIDNKLMKQVNNNIEELNKYYTIYNNTTYKNSYFDDAYIDFKNNILNYKIKDIFQKYIHNNFKNYKFQSYIK